MARFQTMDWRVLLLILRIENWGGGGEQEKAARSRRSPIQVHLSTNLVYRSHHWGGGGGGGDCIAASSHYVYMFGFK